MDWLKGGSYREGYRGKGELETYEAPTLSEDESSDCSPALSWDPKDVSVVAASSSTPSSPRRDALASETSEMTTNGDDPPAILVVTGGAGGSRSFSSILPDMIPTEMKSKARPNRPLSAPTAFSASPTTVSSSSSLSVYHAFDDFGFAKEEDEAVTVVPSGVIKSSDDQKLRWLAHFEFTENQDVGDMTWEKIGHTLSRSSRLHGLVKAGIPHSMRPEIWQRLTQSRKKRDESSIVYKQIVRRALADASDSTAVKQIEKDLLRTMPNNACFSGSGSVGIKRMRNVLRALANFFPEMGYCQGTGMIAGSLLLFMDEEDVFWMMVAIIEDLLPDSYYSQTLIGVQVDQCVLKSLAATLLPSINERFKEHDIELSLITLHWFITTFASVLPMHVLLRVWDLFFYEGSMFLFRFALALLKNQEEAILKSDNSASIFNCVSDCPSKVNVLNIDSLIESAYQLTENVTEDSISLQRQNYFVQLQKELLGRDSDDDRRKKGTVETRNVSAVKRREYSIERRSSLMSLLFGDSRKLSKTKNVEQTEMVSDLRSAIAEIARHFHHDVSDDLAPDYSMQSHVRDHEIFLHSALANSKFRRARALVDFIPQDDDELGFRKHDIITVISQRDDHCWIGELNEKRGWFPAKFVKPLDERSKRYSYAGDDGVSDVVTDLVRGRLASALKALLEHGLKRTSFLGGFSHPWLFIEEASASEVSADFKAVYARLVLCKTYNLEEEGKVLSPDEMLYKAVHMVNMGHDAVSSPLDVKLRSLLCIGLNEQVLHLWLETLCSCDDVVSKWYHPWSFIRSPGWVQLKCELRVLSSFAFNLSIDWEISDAKECSKPIKESIRDMLVKHHLFSWDL
ncbi:small G protein signaling modulator 3-like isoform X2 [Oscarella lobularis]|uniref:small G protein signaling modulator 3-like isoform X2 n=1 Tax=Oscarella lobularis TaxID=121494 RepID=UPI0033140194